MEPARDHLLWLGPVLAIPAFLSYYLFFAQWPLFRDTGRIRAA